MTDSLTERIIGCAIEVHRELGPGLLEATYEAALGIELGIQGIPYQTQVGYPIVYKGVQLGTYRLDMVIDDHVVVEIKSAERLDPVFSAQVLTYLKVSRKNVGLLLNFNSKLLKDGIKRFVL